MVSFRMSLFCTFEQKMTISTLVKVEIRWRNQHFRCVDRWFVFLSSVVCSELCPSVDTMCGHCSLILVLAVVLVGVLVHPAAGYSLDQEHSLEFHGPSSSMFGYSVLLHHHKAHKWSVSSFVWYWSVIDSLLILFFQSAFEAILNIFIFHCSSYLFFYHLSATDCLSDTTSVIFFHWSSIKYCSMNDLHFRPSLVINWCFIDSLLTSHWSVFYSCSCVWYLNSPLACCWFSIDIDIVSSLVTFDL